MDAVRLRALMEGAVASRPPAPHLVAGSLRQGLRIRRRRRVQAAAALAVAIAVAVAAPLVAQALTAKPPPAAPHRGAQTAFVILGTGDHTTMVPVSERSDTRGQAIPIRGQVSNVGVGEVAALSPDGRTLYVLTNAGLTPVNVATRKAGPLIPVDCGRGCYGIGMVLSPDGKTAYVEVGSVPTEPHTPKGVVPVDLATGTDGRLVPVADGPGFLGITRDGRTVYLQLPGSGNDKGIRVLPVSTATDTALPPVTERTTAILSPIGVMTPPRGNTIYLSYGVGRNPRSPYTGPSQELVPLNTAANTLSKPIDVRNFSEGYYSAFSADGQTGYVAGSPGMIRFRTASDTLLPVITMPSWMESSNPPVDDLTTSSDGRTLYVVNNVSGIQPVDAATGTLVKPLRFGTAPRGFQWDDAAAVSADGTVFVSAQRSQNHPGSAPVEIVAFSLATGRAGHPISVGSASVGSFPQIIFAP
jgi:hypothetical protein